MNKSREAIIKTEYLDTTNNGVEALWNGALPELTDMVIEAARCISNGEKGCVGDCVKATEYIKLNTVPTSEFVKLMVKVLDQINKKENILETRMNIYNSLYYKFGISADALPKPTELSNKYFNE